jgi:uncharacterized protein
VPTALHEAAEGDHVAVVSTLLAAGAHVDVTNAAGATPLDYAVIGGAVCAVATLLAAGADVSAMVSR